MSVTTSNHMLIPQSMDQAVRLAELMARSNTLPGHLKGSPGDCLLVVEQAMRWGMSPYAVAQCTSVVHGRLNMEGKLVAAAVNTSPALATRLSYAYDGEGDARTITVSGLLVGEKEPRTMTLRLADVRTDNVWWKKQPDQMLSYAGARYWARRHVPEVMLGVYTPDETPEPTAAQEAGIVIEGEALPASEGDLRDRINAAVPLAEQPPKPRTRKSFLDELEKELASVTTTGQLDAILTREDVTKAAATFDGAYLDRLNTLTSAAVERVAGGSYDS